MIYSQVKKTNWFGRREKRRKREKLPSWKRNDHLLSNQPVDPRLKTAYLFVRNDSAARERGTPVRRIKCHLGLNPVSPLGWGTTIDSCWSATPKKRGKRPGRGRTWRATDQKGAFFLSTEVCAGMKGNEGLRRPVSIK